MNHERGLAPGWVTQDPTPPRSATTPEVSIAMAISDLVIVGRDAPVRRPRRRQSHSGIRYVPSAGMVIYTGRCGDQSNKIFPKIKWPLSELN